MRMISWNMNKAHCDSPSWKYLLDRAPDLVFLQEVNSVPQFVLDTFPHRIECAIRPNDKPQKFHTVILVRGIMGASIKLRGSTDWLNAEHERFKGNLVANQVTLASGPSLTAVNVYSPAWPIPKSRLIGIDTSGIKSNINPDLWVTSLLRDAIGQSAPSPNESWVIAGDFNSSETFDQRAAGPRGNKEFLDCMEHLGFTECLRKSKGKLTPTFRHSRGSIKHQIDHLFVTKSLADKLQSCDVGSQDEIFGASPKLSDHLPIIAEFGV